MMWSTHGGHVSETEDKTDSLENIELFRSVEAGDCIYCKEPHPVISVLTGYRFDAKVSCLTKLDAIMRKTRDPDPVLGVSFIMLSARPGG
jgi:hypothetical protein